MSGPFIGSIESEIRSSANYKLTVSLAPQVGFEATTIPLTAEARTWREGKELLSLVVLASRRSSEPPRFFKILFASPEQLCSAAAVGPFQNLFGGVRFTSLRVLRTPSVAGS